MINNFNPLMTGNELILESSDSPAPLSAGSGEGSEGESEGDSGGGTATLTPTRTKPQRPKVDRMPPWKVILHNDDENEMGYVIETITELTTLSPQAALVRMLEAHDTGVAMLLATHREYAELLQEQFATKKMIVTIEPDR